MIVDLVALVVLGVALVALILVIRNLNACFRRIPDVNEPPNGGKHE